MVWLEDIDSPADLRRLDASELPALAEQIRGFLIHNVARTGGHLGPNLGVVELTLGLHRVFRSPRDSIVFDIGHQTYVHKILTGRRDFSALRRQGGLSGYPSRAESNHDIVESSHASSSLSWADGIARARQPQGDVDRHTVGLHAEFLAHGTREEVLERAGLTGERVAADIVERLQRNCLEKDSTHEFCQVLPQE